MATTATVTQSMRAHAECLLDEQSDWLKARSTVSGRSFWIVPGSNQSAHWVALDGSGCTCRSFNYRGVCSHAEAVRQYNRSESEIEAAFAGIQADAQARDAARRYAF